MNLRRRLAPFARRRLAPFARRRLAPFARRRLALFARRRLALFARRRFALFARRRFALFALLALAIAGCSGQETHVQCLLACDDSITFALSTPLAGRDIAITVGEPDGNVLQLDCQ